MARLVQAKSSGSQPKASLPNGKLDVAEAETEGGKNPQTQETHKAKRRNQARGGPGIVGLQAMIKIRTKTDMTAAEK